MKNIISIILIILSRVSFAQERVDSNKFWLGNALGFGIVEQVRESKGRAVNTSPSFSVDVGFDITRYVSTYSNFSVIKSPQTNANLNILSLGLLSGEPITDELSLYGKVGASYLLGNNNSNGPSGSLGIGAEYRLTCRLSTKLGVDYFNALGSGQRVKSNVTQFYWGFNYYFDNSMQRVSGTQSVSSSPLEYVETRLPAPSENTSKVTHHELLFATNSSTLLSTKALEAPLARLRSKSKLNVRIVAHTDNTGATTYNQWLSDRRAARVAEYFIQHGIGSERISYVGKGEQHPRADNETKEGRKRNRRVEIIIGNLIHEF
ncbi:OmpA family protein [Vibrio mediterranei]|uniref:OmpA family protein n=2 Tax=Vibrio mediterranei TaxID=689 RepID=UPI001EFD6F7D|nr:OmpA family protein [Vibrio mediterranei]MCG9662204.1 OmpA family protein [Vibrio mediterranei]